jgi:hypothetical protein
VSTNHDLAADITNHIISIDSTTPKASAAAKILKSNNSSLDMDSIQFGYINASSQFVSYFDPSTAEDTDLSQSVLSSL